MCIFPFKKAKQQLEDYQNIPATHKSRRTLQTQGKALGEGSGPDPLAWEELVAAPFPWALFAFLSGYCLNSLSKQVFALRFRHNFQKKNLRSSFDIPSLRLWQQQSWRARARLGRCTLHPGTAGLGGHKHQSLGVIRKWRILYLL